MLGCRHIVAEASLLFALCAFCARTALGQYGFVGQPIATIVPASGESVGSLYISPLINTTEGANLLHDDGKSFGTGWLAEGDVAAAESATWRGFGHGQAPEGAESAGRAEGSSVNSFVHIDGASPVAVRSSALNGQLRGKGGVKAVTKAAPAPDLARPARIASSQAVNATDLAGVTHRLLGLSADVQQGGRTLAATRGPGRRLQKLPPPQNTPMDTPDPGICVGKGVIVEIVQQAIAVFSSTTGRLLAGPTPLSDFFGVHDKGIFSFTYCISDISDSKAFFVGALHTSNEDGGPQNRSLLVGPTNTTLYIASSRDPLFSWRGPFTINVTGLDPNNPGIALPGMGPCVERDYTCYTDFVSYGLNADAMWVSSNIIPVNSNGFIGRESAGTVLMGISKVSLLEGPHSQPHYLAFSNFPDTVEFLALSIPQAVKTPEVDATLGNVQYVAQSVQDAVPPQLVFWAVIQTQRIAEGFINGQVPQLVGPTTFHLEHDLVPPTVYFPEGLPTSGASTNHLKLQGARPTQLSLIGGLLYTAISTVVTSMGTDTVGAMYIVGQPHVYADEMAVESVSQGLVGASKTWNILCPALTANTDGQMVMAFSLAGLREDQDLTAGYVPIDPHHGPGDIRLTAGIAPVAIGSYSAGLVSQGRYSTAVADDTGKTWVVSQWQQTMLIWAPNWGTLVSNVDPAVYP